MVRFQDVVLALSLSLYCLSKAKLFVLDADVIRYKHRIWATSYLCDFKVIQLLQVSLIFFPSVKWGSQ